MKKFMVLYRASKTFLEEMNKKNEEEKKREMKSWIKWAEKVDDRLFKFGSPLGNAHEITHSSLKEHDTIINGYSIMRASSMKEAKGLLKDHPHLSYDHTSKIQILEFLPKPK